MKSASTRSLVFLALAIILSAAISFGLNHQSQAVTSCGAGVACPYIKAFGADVFAGGWFANNCAANYQNYQYGTPSDVNNGGILTYANDNGAGKPTGGASSQYGAFALGNIDASTTPGGFYSGGAQGGSLSVGYLSFANTGNTPWGGQFEGAGGNQGHCIPDYYTSKQTNTSVYPAGVPLDTLGSGNYTIDASAGPYSLNLGSGTIAPGTNIAIFVKGDVYIGGDITYAAHNPTNVPRFALVAQGNIYIGPGVSQLTGWYVAQPTPVMPPPPPGTLPPDGVVWTCYDITTPSNASLSTWLTANCNNTLTINGALVAKHVNFRRTNGDVAGANKNEDTLSNALGSNNISEIINYSPDMVIGGPFFNASSSYNLDSLVSLPPVFQ